MLTAAMFLGSFAWSFVYVVLPFHIDRVSMVGPGATLAWTGWILGITSLGAVVSGPIWARLATRGDVKTACVVVQTLQGVGFVATGLARSLAELFLARLALGLVGSMSTFGFMIAGRHPEPVEMRRRLAAMQSALVAGTLVGPLPGAIAGTRLGFRLTFALGGLVLATCGALLQWGMERPPAPPPAAVANRRLPVRDVAVTSAIVLVASCQESFLGAILPRVLPGLGVAVNDVVEAGGLLLFASGAATALGGLAAPYLADQITERRLLPGLLVASSAALILFGVVGSLWAFLALRVVQSACIAPFFPLVVARIARLGSGDAIGIVNAARVGSGLVGAVVATTLLAWGPPPVLYLVFGLAGLGAAFFARR